MANRIFDFFARDFELNLVPRGKDKIGLENFLEMINLRLSYIQTLSFFVGAMDTNSFTETDSTNLQIHFHNLSFLIMNLADDMIIDVEHFREEFQLKNL